MLVMSYVLLLLPKEISLDEAVSKVTSQNIYNERFKGNTYCWA